MSGGYNHYSSCTCPFCLHVSFKELAEPINFRKATAQSYTVPNARCPECHAPVWFYRSPYGGGVYFNELGIPWPKHPCTDTSNRPRRYDRQGSEKETNFSKKWKADGWQPISFYYLGSPDANGVRNFTVQLLETGKFLDLKSVGISDEAPDKPAFIRQTSNGEWEIDTPDGIFPAKTRKRNFNPNALWRKRLLSSKKQT